MNLERGFEPAEGAFPTNAQVEVQIQEFNLESAERALRTQ